MGTTQIIPRALAMPTIDGTAGAAVELTALEDPWVCLIGPATQGHYYIQSTDAYGVNWRREWEVGTLLAPVTLAANEVMSFEISRTAFYVRMWRITQVAGTPTATVEGRI